MSVNMGAYTTNSVITFQFSSQGSDSGMTTFLGIPVLGVFKDGSTSPHTTSVSLTTDFASTVGQNVAAIDSSASAGFYAKDLNFRLSVISGTVGGQSVKGSTLMYFNLHDGSPALADVRRWSNATVATPNTAGVPLTEPYPGNYSSAVTVGVGIAAPSLVTVQVQASSVVSADVRKLNNVTLLGDGSATSFHV